MKEKVWCRHIIFISQPKNEYLTKLVWIFNDHDLYFGCFVKSNWKCCPICQTSRPKHSSVYAKEFRDIFLKSRAGQKYTNSQLAQRKVREIMQKSQKLSLVKKAKRPKEV